MQITLKLIQEVLVDGGVACFVVGSSIIRGQEVDNLSLLERAAKDSGMSLLGTATRTINSNRKSFNTAIARIKQETLAVFGRDA